MCVVFSWDKILDLVNADIPGVPPEHAAVAKKELLDKFRDRKIGGWCERRGRQSVRYWGVAFLGFSGCGRRRGQQKQKSVVLVSVL